MPTPKFLCPLCHWEGHPAFELVDDPASPLGGRLAAKCGKIGCSYMDPNKTPADFNTGIAKEDGRIYEVAIAAAQAEPRAVSAIGPKKQLESRAPAPRFDEPVDAIGLIRSRRDYLEMEVARLEAKKIELRRLNRMLAAADREQAKAELEREQRAVTARIQDDVQ